MVLITINLIDENNEKTENKSGKLKIKILVLFKFWKEVYTYLVRLMFSSQIYGGENIS
jgi:hypothetical protein